MNIISLKKIALLLITCSLIVESGCIETEQIIKEDSTKSLSKHSNEFLINEIKENITEIKIRTDIINAEKELVEINNNETITENVIEYDYEINIADELIDAITNNPYLKDKEKELFLSNKHIFYDNAEYFKYDDVKSNLNNLIVYYFPNENDEITANLWVHDGIAQISIFSANPSDMMLTHEFCHALQPIDNNYPYSGLREIVNVAINNEYFFNNGTIDNAYSAIQKYYFALLSIVGEDTLKRFQFSLDTTEIRNKCMTLVNDSVMFDTLLNDLNLLKDNLLGINDIDYQYYEEEVNNILNQYYYVKYGIILYDENYTRTR